MILVDASIIIDFWKQPSEIYKLFNYGKKEEKKI